MNVKMGKLIKRVMYSSSLCGRGDFLLNLSTTKIDQIISVRMLQRLPTIHGSLSFTNKSMLRRSQTNSSLRKSFNRLYMLCKYAFYEKTPTNCVGVAPCKAHNILRLHGRWAKS